MRAKPLPSAALLSSSDEGDASDDGGDSFSSYANGQMGGGASTAEEEMKLLRRRMADRKKLDTPSPPDNDANAVYSSVANSDGGVYCKIASPPSSIGGGFKNRANSSNSSQKRSREELMTKLRDCQGMLTSESGTASVLEVIEPTSSEEEEFVRSMREMNATWTPSATPRSSSRRRQHARLSLGDMEQQRGGLFQRIAKWKRRSGKKAPPGREAGVEDEEDDDGDLEMLQRAEEHVLPESFEDVEPGGEEDNNHSVTIAVGQNEGQQKDRARKSLSPQSRKTKAMSAEAHSVATSDDSGIVLHHVQQRSIPTEMDVNEASTDPQARLGRIEEVSVVSSASRSSSQTITGQQQQPPRPRRERPEPPARPRRAPGRPAVPPVVSTTAAVSLGLAGLTPVGLLRKKSLESKAWYDVPSDDEAALSGRQSSAAGEAGCVGPEDDSLASIISTKGGSTDDDDDVGEEDY